MSDVQDTVKQLQKQWDQTNQELYECKRQKKTLEALLFECQEDLKNLQNSDNEENKQLKEKIRQLEDTLSSSKLSYNERLEYLEKELECKDKEINDLKRELEEVITLSGKQKLPSDDDKLLEEIACLKEHNAALKEEVEDLTSICENKEMEITNLQETILQLKEDLQSYKENLECKKNEIDEANILIQGLKDDYMCVKSELDLIKSKPLDDKSKGNSLFAEVNDRRVQLQQDMNKMKTKYLEMKRERASHLKQIAVLRTENANLLARWESEIKEQEEEEDMILQSYKNQNRILNELIEGYRKKLKEEINRDDDSITFMDKMLNTKNSEIENLKKKISANSLNEVVLSHDLADARREIRKSHLQILKLENDIGQLTIEMEELKLLKEATEKPQLQREEEEEESELKPAMKLINLDKIGKENNAEDKRVQFSENTLEPQVTDRSKYKRGVKVLESKPIYISSIPKRQEVQPTTVEVRSEIIDLDESNKENAAEKRVGLVENTLESKVADSSNLKLGIKISESKPIQASNVSKRLN